MLSEFPHNAMSCPCSQVRSLPQMVVVFNPSRLGGSKEPDHRRFSLRMCLQVFRHHDISRARQRQSRVVVQFQHLG
jgi:hypothetical protein